MCFLCKLTCYIIWIPPLLQGLQGLRHCLDQRHRGLISLCQIQTEIRTGSNGRISKKKKKVKIQACPFQGISSIKWSDSTLNRSKWWSMRNSRSCSHSVRDASLLWSTAFMNVLLIRALFSICSRTNVIHFHYMILHSSKEKGCVLIVHKQLHTFFAILLTIHGFYSYQFSFVQTAYLNLHCSVSQTLSRTNSHV